MVPKRGRPPPLSGGGHFGPKAEAPSPQRRGPLWVPERAPSRLSGGGAPKATEAPSPERRGPR